MGSAVECRLHNVGGFAKLMIDKCAKMRLIIRFQPFFTPWDLSGSQEERTKFPK